MAATVNKDIKWLASPVLIELVHPTWPSQVSSRMEVNCIWELIWAPSHMPLTVPHKNACNHSATTKLLICQGLMLPPDQSISWPSRGTWCTKSWDNQWWCVKITTALTQIAKVVWPINFLQMQCYRRKIELPDHNIWQHNLRQQTSWKHVQDALSSRWSLIWCKGGNKSKEQKQKVTSHLGSKKQTKEEQRGSFWLLERMWLKGVSRSMTSAAQLVGRSVTGRLIQDAG
jgi:hypothetical protein